MTALAQRVKVWLYSVFQFQYRTNPATEYRRNRLQIYSFPDIFADNVLEVDLRQVFVL